MFAESKERRLKRILIVDDIDFIIDYIERIPPEMIIERFTGEVPPAYHAGPNWGVIRNDQVNERIEKRMEERHTWQGKFLGGNS